MIKAKSFPPNQTKAEQGLGLLQNEKVNNNNNTLNIFAPDLTNLDPSTTQKLSNHPPRRWTHDRTVKTGELQWMGKLDNTQVRAKDLVSTERQSIIKQSIKL